MQVLILECGKGFGGALTSLKAFLDEVGPGADLRVHLLTNYPQDLIREGGSVAAVAHLGRHRLYGPDAKVETALARLLPRRLAAVLASGLDLITTFPLYTARVYLYIRRHGIDLLHLNNTLLINDAGIAAGALAGTPVAAQIRAPEYPSRVAGFLARFVDHFMPVSGFVRDSLSPFGIPDARVTLVPEGLDGARFRRLAGRRPDSDLRLSKARPVIGMVGCLAPWKGQDVFLKACAQLGQEAEILIAGDEPVAGTGEREKLVRLAETLKLRVRFLGHCANVAAVVSRCDIVVHASTAPEPFGRVVLEAMTLGRPVVASIGGGPSEVIDSGEDGLLVPPSDPRALAEALARLLADPELRERMGRAAERKAGCYTAAAHARIIRSVYERMTGRCGRG